MLSDDEKQINRITRLVDDMLDLSRIQMGKLSLSPQPFELAAMAQEVVARMAPLSQNYGCKVLLDTSPVVGVWDRYRLEQILMNLLTNAMNTDRAVT